MGYPDLSPRKSLLCQRQCQISPCWDTQRCMTAAVGWGNSPLAGCVSSCRKTCRRSSVGPWSRARVCLKTCSAFSGSLCLSSLDRAVLGSLLIEGRLNHRAGPIALMASLFCFHALMPHRTFAKQSESDSFINSCCLFRDAFTPWKPVSWCRKGAWQGRWLISEWSFCCCRATLLNAASTAMFQSAPLWNSCNAVIIRICCSSGRTGIDREPSRRHK